MDQSTISKALAITMFAATAVPHSAVAQQNTTGPSDGGSMTVMQLSERDCKVFAGISMDVIKSIGRANLSDEFVRGMIDFAVNKKCTGPYSVPARGRDIDAFVAIDGILGSNKIMLDKIGVRSVKPVEAPAQN